MTGPRDVLDELYGAYEDRFMSDDAHETYLAYAADTLPALVTAVRAVLDLADELDGWQENARRFGAAHPEVSAIAKARELAYRRSADSIRAALTHLAGDHTTGDAP